MNQIFSYLRSIYDVLNQVFEIVKANNQFAQSFEQRLTRIEEKVTCDLPEDITTAPTAESTQENQ